MNILIIGNYKSTNAGDDLYKHILEKTYPQHTFIPNYEVGDRKDIDFVIFGGGGILNNKKLARYELFKKYVIDMGVPGCVLSVGSVGTCVKQPFDNIYPAFSKAKFITCRDKFAFNGLKKYNRITRLLPDLVWNHDITEKPRISNKLTIGVCLRDCTRFDTKKLIDIHLNILNNFIVSGGADLLFFNTYGEKLSSRIMPEIEEYLKQRYPDNIKSAGLFNNSTMIEYLNVNFSQCDMIIGMPFHSIILSCLFKKPIIGFAYESKIIELSKDLNLKFTSNLNNYDIFYDFFNDVVSENYELPSNIDLLIFKSKEHIRLLNKYLN